MKKKLLFVSVLAAVSLASCGVTPSTSEPSEVPPTSETVPTSDPSSPSEVEPTTNSTSNPSIEVSDPTKPEPSIGVLDGIELALSNDHKVASGTFLKTDSYGSETKATYEFGVDKYGNFTKISQTSYGSTTQYVYGYDKQGEIYGLENYGFGWNKSMNVISEDDLYGPLYITFNYSTKLKGVKGILEYYKNAIELNTNKDYAETVYGDKFSFSMGIVQGDYSTNLFLVDISFALTDGVLLDLTYNTKSYDQDSIVQDFENDGVYYVKDDAQPTFSESIVYTQTVGERVAQNEHDIESYYFESFDLFDSDENNASNQTYKVNAGGNKVFNIKNIEPSTALLNIDNLTIKVVEGSENGIYGLVDTFEKFVNINFNEVGNYKVEVYSKNHSVYLNFEVAQPLPSSISTVMSYVPSGSQYNINVVENSINVYVNTPIYVKASLEPYSADQSYEVSAKDDIVTIEKTQIVTFANMDPIDVHKLNPLQEGSTEIVFTSSVDSSITRTIAINVLPIPAPTTFAGKNVNIFGGVLKHSADLKFTSDTSGTVDILYTYQDPATFEASTKAVTYDFNYDSNTKEFVLTHDSVLATDVALYLDGNCNLVLEIKYPTYSDYATLQPYDPKLLIIGLEWMWKSEDGNSSVTIVFYESGSCNFSYMKRSSENYWSIVEECWVNGNSYSSETNNDIVTISFDEAAITDINNSQYIDDFNGKVAWNQSLTSCTLDITINGVTQTLTLEKNVY